MEYDWERTFPFLEINRDQSYKIISGYIKKRKYY